MTAIAPTLSQVEAENIRYALKARNCTLWVVTSEEARVEPYLASAAGAAGFMPRFWDCGAGVTDLQGRALGLDGRVLDAGEPSPSRGADVVLDLIRDASGRKGGESFLWVLRDFPAWITGPGAALTLRPLRNLARALPFAPAPQAIVVLTPSTEVPPELQGHATVVRWPMPDRAELASLLDVMVRQYKIDLNGSREAAIDAAVGLSGEEAASCFSSSLVRFRTIEPAAVAQEKKAVIAKAGLLEWMDALAGGFASVGGLDVVKAWIIARTAAYTPEARAYGLPMPRGIVLVGRSGCGKTYIAKAIATALGNVPLIRLDVGALKSKFMGESENNLRKAFATIGAIGKCVVLIDELEKAMAGAVDGGADGGVSADQLGALLTWMQERKTEAFIIATSNDVSRLPPELLRKGRWDELFWVDLPTRRERSEVLAAALKTHGRGALELDLGPVVNVTEGFSGAELASLVPDALFAAFADGGRELDAKDLIVAAGNVTPLSKTAKEKFAQMKEWSIGRARPATTPDVEAVTVATPAIRTIDM